MALVQTLQEYFAAGESGASRVDEVDCMDKLDAAISSTSSTQSISSTQSLISRYRSGLKHELTNDATSYSLAMTLLKGSAS